MSARIQPFSAPRVSDAGTRRDELARARWDDVERALLALPSVAAYRARDMGARLSLHAGDAAFCAVAVMPLVDGAVGFLARGDASGDYDALVAIRNGDAALVTRSGLVGGDDDVRMPVRAVRRNCVGVS